MTEDKSKQGSGDRSRVAGGEDYEVQHFAERHGISPDKARRLIMEHGNDRAKLEKSKMKRETKCQSLKALSEPSPHIAQGNGREQRT